MRISRAALLLGVGLVLAGCDLGTVSPGDPASVEIRPGEATAGAIGDTVKFAAKVDDGDERTIATAPVVWTSLDPEIARARSDGRVVPIDTGTARIEAASGAVADTALLVVDAAAPENSLVMVQFSDSAPALETYDTSFWAVKGDSRELVIEYADSAGDPLDEFMEFDVSGKSLYRRPDGAAFVTGDSIRIHVTVDPTGFQLSFEPSGLKFNPDRPAELELTYLHADKDLDGDGRPDENFDHEVDIWTQEEAGGLWFRMATAELEDLEEVEADVYSFTAFSLAGH